MSVEREIDRLLEEELGGDFLSGAWGRAPFFSRGRRGRFASVVTWSDLNELLDVAAVEDPSFVLLRAGNTVPASEYTRPASAGARMATQDRIDPVRLQAILRRGATLQINGAPRALPRLARVGRRFARHFRTKVLCNLYLSYAATGAAPTHWDAGDGFFLQLAGRKRWQVYEPVRMDPLARDVEFSGQYRATPAWEGELHAGDVLYVPRGWFHAPQPDTGEGALSLHATVGLEPVTGVELLTWLTDELRAVELVRRELPRFSSATEQRSHAEAIWTELEKRWHEHIVGEFLTFDNAVAHVRGRSSLPWSVEGSVPVDHGFAVVSGTPRPSEPREQNGDLVVEALGKQWRLDPRAGPLVSRVLAGAAVTADELPRFAGNGLSVEDVHGLITTLVEDGLLAVVEV